MKCNSVSSLQFQTLRRRHLAAAKLRVLIAKLDDEFDRAIDQVNERAPVPSQVNKHVSYFVIFSPHARGRSIPLNRRFLLTLVYRGRTPIAALSHTRAIRSWQF